MQDSLAERGLDDFAPAALAGHRLAGWSPSEAPQALPLLPNRANRLRRISTAMVRLSAPRGCLRLGSRRRALQNPAEWRETCRRLALGRRILRSRGLVGGESRIRTLSTPRRIWGESEPPNLPTEKNAGCCSFEAPNPRSPVRMREGPTAKTPRNRGNFSCCSEVRAGSLCSGRLGGGESRIRTLSTPRRIWSESEPPNLPTEKNAGCCAFEAPNPPSPVRMRESPTAKTPRNRGNFSGCT